MDILKKYNKLSLILFLFSFASLKLTAQTNSPVVTEITSSLTSNGKISISWTNPENLQTKTKYISSYLIYRDTKPIVKASSIKDKKPCAVLPQGCNSYTDTIKDRYDYYYAVICNIKSGDINREELYYDEELDEKPETNDGIPYFLIIPGVNSTLNGIKANLNLKKVDKISQKNTKNTKESKNQTKEIREQPLPYIDILGYQENEKSIISETVKENAMSFATKNNNKKKKEEIYLSPYIFEEDLLSPQGGDEYILFDILKTSFIQQNYQKSIQDLNNFMLQNRNENVLNRAKFYLSESYYFNEDYPKALSILLELKDTYSTLCTKWIESSLDLFQITE